MPCALYVRQSPRQQYVGMAALSHPEADDRSDMYILGHSDGHVSSQMPKPLSSAKVQSPWVRRQKVLEFQNTGKHLQFYRCNSHQHGNAEQKHAPNRFFLELAKCVPPAEDPGGCYRPSYWLPSFCKAGASGRGRWGVPCLVLIEMEIQTMSSFLQWLSSFLTYRACVREHTCARISAR